MKFPKRVWVAIFILLGAGVILLANTWGDKNQRVKTDVNMILKQLSGCRDERCLGEKLKEVTTENGPALAIRTLELFEKNYPDRIKSDFHESAHIIGRKTAEVYGINGDAFLSCPESFNYGCQHGFFEKALAKTPSVKAAIEQICGAFEGNAKYTPKFQFYCYHGVGHGVMMAQAYDLSASLSVCDSLKSLTAQEGCWQGVFMENVNAVSRGEARAGIFLNEDPLAPCNKIDTKYQWQCYINHAGYLVNLYKNDVKLASSACLAAPAPQSQACLESIGLMVSNKGIQDGLLPVSAPGQTLEIRAWQLCQQFPQTHTQPCVYGAVDQILNFDGLDIRSAKTFCQTVADQYKIACFERMGMSVRSQATSLQQTKNKCLEISASAERDACLRGAGVSA